MQKKTAIVVPCYNEEIRLNIEVFISFYNQTEYSFCFVNDGSTDDTISILHKIQESREDKIFIIDRKKNKGKAESIREGILFMQKKNSFLWLGFLDADLATPLLEITSMLEYAAKNDKLKMIIGTRFRRLGSSIERSTSRFLIGRAFATTVGILLGLPVYDTQCGAKIFRNDIIDEVFSDEFTSSWLFDVELFFRITQKHGKKAALKMILEHPLSNWYEVKGSKLKFYNFLKMPFELLKIVIKYK